MYAKLKGLIKEYCGTQKIYAEYLGMSLPTLNSRLKGDTYFNTEEIKKSAEIFDLNDTDIIQIFFIQ